EWLPWQRCDIGGSFTKEADGELPGGVNLDSMVTSGWWSQSFTAQAATGANYPIVRAGLLHVYAASSNFIYQTYQAYDGESFYFRCRHSNTWFPWRRMWHGGDFNPSDYLLKSGFYWNALPGKPATFPPSAHNHDVGQLTSGILPLARGGVGSNTAAGARSTIGAGVPATASLGASGWWRDNDTGLIRQWGQVTCPADADASITFPIPFPTLCLGGYANQTSAFHPGTDASTGFRGATTTTAVIRNGYFAQAVLSWEAFGR
ncbi:pyocin knob domain-containing protein, partial [Pseudomonas aeruginosa]